MYIQKTLSARHAKPLSKTVHVTIAGHAGQTKLSHTYCIKGKLCTIHLKKTKLSEKHGMQQTRFGKNSKKHGKSNKKPLKSKTRGNNETRQYWYRYHNWRDTMRSHRYFQGLGLLLPVHRAQDCQGLLTGSILGFAWFHALASQSKKMRFRAAFFWVC